VICHGLQRLVYGLAARRVAGGALVLYIHNTSEIEALRHLPALRWLLRWPDRLVAVSPAIARRLVAVVPAARVSCTSTGVDTRTFRDLRRERRPQLAVVAHFKWKKGYRYLLEAVSRVFARFPDHRLVIVGDGEDRSAIVDMVQRLGLSSQVQLAGILSRGDVVRVLNDSRLFVLASIHEGLPRALLEAIACGTPAVVTETCNAEGIIDTTGLCVPPGDPAALADAINRLLGDRVLWEQCARNGPAVAARYDWRAVAARDHLMYRALLARPSRPPGHGSASDADTTPRAGAVSPPDGPDHLVTHSSRPTRTRP
jgi:glycosyltransferase involved in cell wall biosynthesis